MKIINLKGGLGNQMFQYAYGRNLELAGERIIFNTSFFNGARPKVDTFRDFKLDNFNIETKARFSDKKYLIYDFVNKILTKLHLKEDGYWQSEKYFKNIESDIRREFTLKKILDSKFDNIIEKINNTPSISVHIRRGDYINDPKTKAFHNVCNLDYYSTAIDTIKAQVNNPTFFVFSDDIDWAEKNLNTNSPTFWISNLGGEDYKELILMSKCKHNIISNSSFSWWGAWLNQNPDKIVIGPKQWFAHKTSNELDILPKTWLQI